MAVSGTLAIGDAGQFHKGIRNDPRRKSDHRGFALRPSRRRPLLHLCRSAAWQGFRVVAPLQPRAVA
jgi:hypothetical protein